MKNRIFYFVALSVLLLWTGFNIETGRFKIGNTRINDSTSALTTFNKSLYIGGGYIYGRDSVLTNSLTGGSLYFNGIGSGINWRGGSSSQISEGTNQLIYLQNTHSFGTKTNTSIISFDSANCITIKGSILIRTGTGTPEAAITAPVGSLFLRTDNANSFYVKQTGSGNTGWVLK